MKGKIGKRIFADRLLPVFFFVLLFICGNPGASSTVFAAEKDISACSVSLSQAAFIYSGRTHSPVVTVTDGETVLREGVDYKIYGGRAYTVGIHEITIVGSGDYVGQAAVYFEIKKAQNQITLESDNVLYTYSEPWEGYIWFGVKGNAKLHFQTSTKGASLSEEDWLSLQDGFLGKVVIHVTSEETESYLAASADFSIEIKLKGTSITGFSDGGAIGPADNDHTTTVKWAVGDMGIQSVGGFEIRYSKDPNFQSGVYKAKIPMLNALGIIVNGCTVSKGLKKGDRAYFQIRTYKKALDGSTYYSDWSETAIHGIDSSEKAYYRGKYPKNGKIYQYEVSGGKSRGCTIRFRYKNGELAVDKKQDIHSHPAKIIIPDKVKIYGRYYPVTSIQKGAFKGEHISKIVIGKNVKKIGANAFSGVYGVKNITIKSRKLTAKSVAKNAFKNFNRVTLTGFDFSSGFYNYVNTESVKLTAPKPVRAKCIRLLKKRGMIYGIK